MPNAVIYARYSSQKQREESIEGQLRRCNDYAEKHGMNVIGEYCDKATSGRTADRPEFQRLLKDSMKKMFDVVLVWNFDRFARNRGDSAIYKGMLQKNGIKVYSVTQNIPDDNTGVIIESLFEGMAEYYSLELAEKVTRGMQENAMKGKCNGGYRTYGYNIVNEHYEINENEAIVVKQVFDMYANGRTNKDILEHINSKGYRTPQGREFTHEFLYRMLRNKKYIGLLCWNGIEFADGIEPIVDKRIFEKAQKRLDEKSNTGARANAIEPYALVGKVFCGKCNQPMVADSVKKKNKYYNPIKTEFSIASLNSITSAIDEYEDGIDINSEYIIYRYYVCRGKKQVRHKNNCDKKRVEKDALENLVVEYTSNQYLCDENISRLAKAVYNLQEKAKCDEQKKKIQDQIREEVNKINNLFDMVESGIKSTIVYERISQAENKKSELQKMLDKLEREYKVMKIEDIEESLKNVRDRMREICKQGKLTPKIKKEFCDTFIDSVYVYDDDDNGGSRIRIVFDPFETEGLEGFNEVNIDFGSTISMDGSPKQQSDKIGLLFFYVKSVGRGLAPAEWLPKI